MYLGNLKFLLLFMLPIFFIGCQRDLTPLEECLALEDLGTLYLDEFSKNFMAYQEGEIKIIFSDSLGNEYVGVGGSNGLEYQSWGSLENCPIDPSIQIDYRWMAEALYFGLDLEELQLGLSVEIFVLPYLDFLPIENKYLCFIRMEKRFAQDNFLFVGKVAFVGGRISGFDSSFTDFKREFVLHDRQFHNVYIFRTGQAQEYDLYYSPDSGIIGFKSKVNPEIDLKFERVE